MSMIVLKFGGTSVANLDRIKSVAQRIAREVNLGHQVAVVVSAMAGVTNQLIGWAYDSVPHHPNPLEYDVVVSTGEQITSGLLALVLQGMNIPARSWQAWQLPILTDDIHGRAQQITISPAAIMDSLNQGQVAVVAGFQGIDSKQRITTLGRGGSDTTAVALAHALKAERCDIYTDVEGVFTADPRIVNTASKINKITYGEMLELAWQGAKVLQPQSVELAMKHKVVIRVLSSFSEGSGTWVVDNQAADECPAIVGLASNCNIAKITLKGIADHLKFEEYLRESLEKAHICIDWITEISSQSSEERDFIFIASREDMDQMETIIARGGSRFNFSSMESDYDVANIALVGREIGGQKKIISGMIQVLRDNGIKTFMISQSSLKISALISKHYADEALKVLHGAFNLEQKEDKTIKIA